MLIFRSCDDQTCRDLSEWFETIHSAPSAQHSLLAISAQARSDEPSNPSNPSNPSLNQSANGGLRKHPVRHLELKIPPLALCAVFAAAIAVFAHFVPAANVPVWGHRPIGLAAMLIGIALAVAGVVEFRRARTTVNPLLPGTARSVVASGVYRFTRNPMYLGMAVALFGMAAWFSSLAGVGLIPIFCLYLTQFQIKPEERALLASFGEAFASYMAKVRRWV